MGEKKIGRSTRLPRITLQLKTNIFTEKKQKKKNSNLTLNDIQIFALLYTMNYVAQH